jgi:hypothetical protein
VALALPVPFTSPIKLTGSLTQCGPFEGWHDIGFLHTLAQKDKANINALQRIRGFAITDFDQIALKYEKHQRTMTSVG